MKIAVLNNSGNVGKTLVTRHLLAPRLGLGCKRFAVESINHGADGDKYRGRNFRSVITALQIEEHAVVDIGSSNVEDVYEVLDKMPGALDTFDLFVVPTTPLRKQHVDTLATIKQLRDRGTPLSKVRVIFNMVEHGVPPVEACPELVEALAELGLSTKAAIHQNELYELVGDESVSDFAGDIASMRRDLASAATVESKREIATAIGLAMLANGVERELDAVFAEVVGQPAFDRSPAADEAA